MVEKANPIYAAEILPRAWRRRMVLVDNLSVRASIMDRVNPNVSLLQLTPLVDLRRSACVIFNPYQHH
jgi:hypothetical protein